MEGIDVALPGSSAFRAIDAGSGWLAVLTRSLDLRMAYVLISVALACELAIAPRRLRRPSEGTPNGPRTSGRARRALQLAVIFSL